MKKERLYSLDLLRGLDMFLLAAMGLPLRTIQNNWNWFSPTTWRHFCHGWTGFGLWDIIMPLFIFMCGAAIPFSLEKRLVDGRPTRDYWRHVIGRVALLWVFGMVAQGELLSLDPMKISPYNNTLQSIAAGYLITAVVLCWRSVAARVAVPIVLALAYTLLLAFGGDYSETGNFAERVELGVLAQILPKGSSAFQTGHYTWFLTSLMFGAMTLCGYHATKILQLSTTAGRKVSFLIAYAVVLFAVGFGTAPWIPVIKPIYTLSFTAQAMGWSVLSLAVLYVLTDIYRFRRGLGLFILLGRHSLFTYMAGCFGCVFVAAAGKLLGGLALWIGQAPMPLVQAVGVSCLKLWSVWIWDRLRRVPV